jgi:hypothetical protein
MMGDMFYPHLCCHSCVTHSFIAAKIRHRSLIQQNLHLTFLSCCSAFKRSISVMLSQLSECYISSSSDFISLMLKKTMQRECHKELQRWKENHAYTKIGFDMFNKWKRKFDISFSRNMINLYLFTRHTSMLYAPLPELQISWWLMTDKVEICISSQHDDSVNCFMTYILGRYGSNLVIGLYRNTSIIGFILMPLFQPVIG